MPITMPVSQYPLADAALSALTWAGPVAMVSARAGRPGVAMVSSRREMLLIHTRDGGWYRVRASGTEREQIRRTLVEQLELEP